MSRPWRSLRVQLAMLGFLAIYLPVLLVLGVTVVSEEETADSVGGVVVVDASSSAPSLWTTGTVLALGPVAAALAWWLGGRAVRPIGRVQALAEEIEASDLSRRIGLDRAPSEVLHLAASFDAMLDRLERAADLQRRLIEETSHELRTPLSVLRTNADVLLAHPDPSAADYRRGLERSKAATMRMLSTIDQLLVDARGRARTLDRQAADVTATTRSIVDEVSVLAAARGVDVVLTAPPTAVCSVDEPTVRRAILNLVDNALRYAPRGSAVEISVSTTPTAVDVVVVDHGPGIAEEDQVHVFDRFWPPGSDSHGTGLGLHLARHVALAHGGDLTLRSPGPSGDGCAFRLRLHG